MLSKNEICVLLFLFGSRNSKTGQCNPRQKTIAEGLGMDKFAVSRAMSGLIKLGCIERRPGGQIDLLKVAENATFEEVEVAENATEVAESTTESCGVDNSRSYKEQKRNNEGTNILPATAGDEWVVFEYWQKTLGQEAAKFDKARKGKIKARLAEGYTVEQLKQAVDGCRVSDYHMGINEDGKRYDNIGLIFRDGEKVEQFIGYATSSKGGQHHATAKSNNKISGKRTDADVFEESADF